MGKEQELLATVLQWVECVPHHVDCEPGRCICGRDRMVELLAARRSSSDEAEVVGFDAAKAAEKDILREYELGNLTTLGVANHLRRAGFNLKYATDKANSLTVASPSGVKAGVTEEMVTRACEEAGWVVDPAAFEADPAEANRITSAYRAGMADILTAALGVGDEGMGEGWQPIATAKRDGRMLQLWNQAHDEQVIAGWTPRDFLGMDEYPTADEGAWTNAGSKNQAINWMYNPNYFQFWRDLPTPPIQGDAT